MTPGSSGNFSTHASKAVMGIVGFPVVSAKPLMVVRPMRIPVKDPGPEITANACTSHKVSPRLFKT
jgi:hypothetical protein